MKITKVKNGWKAEGKKYGNEWVVVHPTFKGLFMAAYLLCSKIHEDGSFGDVKNNSC